MATFEGARIQTAARAVGVMQALGADDAIVATYREQVEAARHAAS